jgi:exodeoxyribonuclease VII large subunit
VLAGHDPQRTLERGYALAETADGGRTLASAEAARAARELRLRFADGTVQAEVSER